MNNFLALTKVMLKVGGESFPGKKGKGRTKSFLFFLLLLAAFTPLAISFGIFIGNTYDVLAGIQQELLILGFGLSVVSLVIFFFGIFYSMNVYYFSMDINSLLPLPLRSSEILGAKFATILVYEYLTESILFLPVIISYGLKSSAGIPYYIYSLAIFLMLPIIPLTIAGLLNMIIMRFTNIAKNKDRFKVIGGIIAMFFGVGLNMVIQRMTNTNSQEKLLQMFTEGNNSMVSLTTRLFPSTSMAVNTLSNSTSIKGFLNLLLFILITSLTLAIFIFIGEALYFKGVIGVSETTSKRKKLSNEQLEKEISQKSPLRTYTLKELRLLFRTPIYFLNCVLMNFLFPVFLILPLAMQNGGLSNIEGLSKYITVDSPYMSIVISAAFAIMVFIGATNAVTSTAISREGDKLFVSKYIPISYKTQIMAKALSGITLGLIGMTTMLLAALIILKFQIPLLLIAMTVVLGVLGIIFSSFTGLLIDLNNPKLQWDSEQKAVKQNMNVIFNMLICLAIAGVTVFIIIKLKLTLAVAFLVIFGVFLVINIVLYYFLSTMGVKLFENMQS